MTKHNQGEQDSDEVHRYKLKNLKWGEGSKGAL